LNPTPTAASTPRWISPQSVKNVTQLQVKTHKSQHWPFTNLNTGARPVSKQSDGNDYKSRNRESVVNGIWYRDFLDSLHSLRSFIHTTGMTSRPRTENQLNINSLVLTFQVRDVIFEYSTSTCAASVYWSSNLVQRSLCLQPTQAVTVVLVRLRVWQAYRITVGYCTDCFECL